MAHQNLRPPLFEGENFLSWKKLMIFHAMGEEWLDQMEGKEPKPVVADPLNVRQVAAEKAWITRDRKIEHMIGLSIAQSIVLRLDLTKNSAEIWKWLCDTYEGKARARDKGDAKDLDEEIKRNQCRNCKEFEHWVYKCLKKKGKKKYQANMTNNDSSEELTLAEEVLCTQIEVEGFIVDSGCTSVMIKDKGMLYDCKKSPGSVQIGSKTEIPIDAVGALVLEVGAKRVELPEVLHVPNLRRNLLSVLKLADLGIVTVFDRNKVVSYESGAKIKGARLAQGLRSENLWTVVYLLKKKSDAFSAFQRYKASNENQTGRKIKKLRSDGGGEYNSNQFKQFCEDHEILRQVTIAYTPQLNGVAERKNRPIEEGSKSLLTESKIAKRFWEHAVGVTVKIQSCLITSALDKKTPYELWHGRKSNLEKFRVFRRKQVQVLGSDSKKDLVSLDVAFAERVDIPDEQEGSDRDVDFMKSKELELIWVPDAPAPTGAQGRNPADVDVGIGQPGKGPAAAEHEIRRSAAEQEFRRPSTRTVTEDRCYESESESQELINYEPTRRWVNPLTHRPRSTYQLRNLAGESSRAGIYKDVETLKMGPERNQEM
ncbi:hypothetical protein R1sor_005420 [Riccia sorocarpa]|uniref:Integrase catalytic domain-containing protein n=1 Tax=Riccia sorocarpa TaxID=122646 RepID=A0ABD3HN57_9MARC